VDSEYREPSWRGVILTLVAVIVVTGGLVLLASFLLQENCLPVASQVDCAVPSLAPDPGTQ
jgi:hypothetical protein